MRYVLNSAVITQPGVYAYRILSIEEAKAWLARGEVLSRVGYEETREYIRAALGVSLPLSREASLMRPGDEALVVRLKYRVPDPSRKGRIGPADADWEIGLLTMLESDDRR